MAQVYIARIITSEFKCNALNEEDAEEKYAAWFDAEPCKCNEQGLECICGLDDNCVDHIWETDNW